MYLSRVTLFLTRLRSENVKIEYMTTQKTFLFIATIKTNFNYKATFIVAEDIFTMTGSIILKTDCHISVKKKQESLTTDKVPEIK